MKVFVAKVLVEDIDLNSCSVKLFANKEDAIKWADEEIDIYGCEYKGDVMERADDYYSMHSGDAYVTIEIEEHEIENS